MLRLRVLLFSQGRRPDRDLHDPRDPPGLTHSRRRPRVSRSIAPMSAEPFVMRPMWASPGDTMSIRLKGADLVVIDGLARRFCFPLGGPESPCFVVKYLHSGAKNQ